MEADYREKLRLFFDNFSYVLRKLEQVRKNADRYLASQFNVIEIFARREEDLSRAIAVLLDPKGGHGQGTIFLQKFLDLLEINQEYALEEAKVITEATTDELRRIDILIEFPEGFAIGIENKPWAGDQKSQIEDYAQFLDRKTNGNYKLLFLGGNRAEPSEFSIPAETRRKLEKDKKLICKDYKNFLHDWLKECLRECEADKVRWFIRDFIVWIEKEFRGGKIMDNYVREIIENFLLEGNSEMKRERFSIAWDIWANFDRIKKEKERKNIFNRLAEEIKKKIDDTYKITYVDWGGIYVAKPEWQQGHTDTGIYSLCVDKWGRTWPTVGVKRNAHFTTSIDDEIYSLLSSVRDLSYGKTKDFLFYIGILDWRYGNLKEYYYNVFYNSEEIVKFLLGYFMKLYEIIRNTKGLEELLDQSVEERKKALSSGK